SFGAFLGRDLPQVPRGDWRERGIDNARSKIPYEATATGHFGLLPRDLEIKRSVAGCRRQSFAGSFLLRVLRTGQELEGWRIIERGDVASNREAKWRSQTGVWGKTL